MSPYRKPTVLFPFDDGIPISKTARAHARTRPRACTHENLQDWIKQPVQPLPSKMVSPFDPDDYPPELIFQHVLIHAAAYYRLGHSVISDFEYERLFSYVREAWDTFSHPLKSLVDIELLQDSTSLFYVDFPSRVIGCAEYLVEFHRKYGRLPEL